MKAVAFPHLPLPTPDRSIFGVNHFTRAHSPSTAALCTTLPRCFPAISKQPKTRTHSIPRRDAPELCIELGPSKAEGAGNAGRPLHPEPRV